MPRGSSLRHYRCLRMPAWALAPYVVWLRTASPPPDGAAGSRAASIISLIKPAAFGLLAWAALQVVVVAVAPPLELPADLLDWADFMVKVEASASARLLSLAALMTGAAGFVYVLCGRLRRASGATIAKSPPAGSFSLRISLRTELFIILSLLALLFVINFATAEIYPLVWVDEVGYIDPGLNLALGNGLTSSAWPNVYWAKFWYSFPPLFPALVAAWITLFGISLTAIRLLNVALISIAALALWRYAVRCGLFPNIAARIAIVLLPLLGYGVSFGYRNARPDTLGLLISVLALNASIIDNRRWRIGTLIVLGVMVPWAGPHLAAFAVILGLLVAIWWPRRAVTVFVPLGAGMAFGLAALFGFYAAFGGLYGFLASTFGSVNSITGQVLQVLFLDDPRGLRHLQQLPRLLMAVVFEDRSSAFLGAAAIMLLIALRRGCSPIAYRSSGFAVIAAFGIPILTALAGQYWLNYTWTGFLTVGIALLVSIETAPPSLAGTPARRLAIGCIAAALLLGLPLQLSRAYAERGARDYDALRVFVGNHVSRGDWVYTAPQAYFAIAELGAVPVTDEYARGRLAPGIPAEQRSKIKLFIVHPNEVDAAIERLGGTWIQTGPPLAPLRPNRLVWYEPGELAEPYRLVAYGRRAAP
jgi:hypothetical protein